VIGPRMKSPKKARLKGKTRIYLHNGRTACALVRRVGLMYLRGAYLLPQGWDVVEALDGCWWTDSEGNIVRRELAVAVEAG